MKENVHYYLDAIISNVNYANSNAELNKVSFVICISKRHFFQLTQMFCFSLHGNLSEQNVPLNLSRS